TADRGARPCESALALKRKFISRFWTGLFSREPGPLVRPATREVRSRMGAAPLGTNDPLFDTPFVDVDEWRDDPVHHRYVHGGFEGTDTLFSMYFPPPERYE